MSLSLIIGSRASFLAKIQSFIVKQELQKKFKKEIILEHFDNSINHYGEEIGVKSFRKHIGWYTKGMHGSAEFRNRANFLDNAQQVLGEIERFYAPFIERMAA